ncbi:MAG: ADP-ribose diphosphatase [Succinivibrionaceae bacterium]
MFTRDDVNIVRKERCYDGFFKLNRYTLQHRLFSGELSGTFTRELFERGHAAAIMLYDPKQDQVVMIEQFRIGAYAADMGPWLYEVVAGVNDADESMEDVVRREASEEAGVQVTSVKFITRYLVSPGGTSETISLYLGLVDASDASGVHGLASENEDIKVHVLPFSEVLKMTEKGEICNSTAIIAVYYLALHRQEYWQQSDVECS